MLHKQPVIDVTFHLKVQRVTKHRFVSSEIVSNWVISPAERLLRLTSNYALEQICQCFLRLTASLPHTGHSVRLTVRDFLPSFSLLRIFSTEIFSTEISLYRDFSLQRFLSTEIFSTEIFSTEISLYRDFSLQRFLSTEISLYRDFLSALRFLSTEISCLH